MTKQKNFLKNFMGGKEETIKEKENQPSEGKTNDEMDNMASEEESTGEAAEKEIDEEDKSEEEIIIEQQGKRIDELENEIEQIRDKQLRKTAEMENMKRRMQKERITLYERAKENAVEAFLPVNDDLIRMLESMESSDRESPFYEGIKMISDKFNEVLSSYGIERIDETGVPFDVDLHDAMLRQKAGDDSVESGTVMQVVESGYRIGEKTLRHAKVIVSE